MGEIVENRVGGPGHRSGGSGTILWDGVGCFRVFRRIFRRFMGLGVENSGFWPSDRLGWPGMAEIAENGAKMAKNGEKRVFAVWCQPGEFGAILRGRGGVVSGV